MVSQHGLNKVHTMGMTQGEWRQLIALISIIIRLEVMN